MSRYTIEYPGLTGLTGDATITRVRGTAPAVIQLRAGLFNASLVAVGDLVLKKDGSVIRRLRDCAYVEMAFESAAAGSTVLVTLHDRRWRWHRGGGTVTGSYNSRNSDGSIQEESRKTFKELLEICFKQLGETRVDYTAVPPIQDPVEVFWDHLRTVDALNSLMSAYGLTLDLLADNSIKMILIGSNGAALPDLPVISYQSKFANLAAPDILKVIGAPVRWQAGLHLRAVGLDLDGKWKPVASLSYAPSGGWGKVDPKLMLGLSTGTSAEDKERRQLALQTVYRCYEFYRPADYDHAVEEENEIWPELPESFGNIEHAWQHVVSNKLFTTVDNDDETSVPRPAVIRGVFWDAEYGLENTVPQTRYDGSWQIDNKNGLVRFPRPVYKFNDDGDGYEFADLYLFCTLSLVNTRRLPHRYTKSRQLKVGTNEHPRSFGDLEHQITINYTYDATDERWERSTVTTNADDLTTAANYYLNGVAQEMSPEQGETRPMEGWLSIELDGQISQVTWNWNAHVATTVASKNTEHRSILPYKSARLMMEAAAADKVQGKTLEKTGVPVALKAVKR